MGFLMPKMPKPQPAPVPSTQADTSVLQAGLRSARGYRTLIGTSKTGLSNRAKTSRTTLIGKAAR